MCVTALLTKHQDLGHTENTSLNTDNSPVSAVSMKLFSVCCCHLSGEKMAVPIEWRVVKVRAGGREYMCMRQISVSLKSSLLLLRLEVSQFLLAALCHPSPYSFSLSGLVENYFAVFQRRTEISQLIVLRAGR